MGASEGVYAFTRIWWHEAGPPLDPLADMDELHLSRARVLQVADRVILGMECVHTEHRYASIGGATPAHRRRQPWIYGLSGLPQRHSQKAQPTESSRAVAQSGQSGLERRTWFGAVRCLR